MAAGTASQIDTISVSPLSSQFYTINLNSGQTFPGFAAEKETKNINPET
jgi:hypothetical protein